MYKYSKTSQITELAKHARVKHGHEQCFLKDWLKSQNCFEDEPKNEQRKGSCPQDAPGHYLLKKWHCLGKAYPKQHVRKESVAMRRWGHVMAGVYPKLLFQGTFSIYYALGQRLSVNKNFLCTMQLCGTSKYFTYPGWRLKKSRNLRRFIFTIWKKKRLWFCSLKWCIPFELDLN